MKGERELWLEKRVEELETERETARHEWPEVAAANLARAEKAERERDEWRDLARAEGADEEHERRLVRERDEARAEVERERRERISAELGCEVQAAARYLAEAEVARLSGLLAQYDGGLTPEAQSNLAAENREYRTVIAKRSAEVDRLREEKAAVVSTWTEVQCRLFAVMIDARLDELGCTVDSTFRHGKDEGRREAEAEVARLRDIISPGDAAAYEEGMAALQAALREWREAESSPDCIACCTLDAALIPGIK